MPYILLKRKDVDNGVLQILDIKPNTSQRNLTIDPPGQSKYVRVPLNDRVVTVGDGPVVSYIESKGLAAWFLTNVAAAPAAAASVSGQVDEGGILVGETFTLGTTTLTAVAANPNVNEFVAVGDQGDDTAALVAAINDPGNGTAGVVTAADQGDGAILVTAVVPGAAGNHIVSETTSPTFTWAKATLEGGSDVGALTATQAFSIASRIMTTLLRFGVSASAQALSLVAVNAQIAFVVPTAAITQDQLSEVLDILSGREYVLPKGTQIANANGAWEVSPAVGTAKGPHFVDPSFRRSYESDDFIISWDKGSLKAFRDDSFSYKGVTGAMVAVYGDDGNLYTPPT